MYCYLKYSIFLINLELLSVLLQIRRNESLLFFNFFFIFTDIFFTSRTFACQVSKSLNIERDCLHMYRTDILRHNNRNYVGKNSFEKQCLCRRHWSGEEMCVTINFMNSPEKARGYCQRNGEKITDVGSRGEFFNGDERTSLLR